jgi:hypothetical protein
MLITEQDADLRRLLALLCSLGNQFVHLRKNQTHASANSRRIERGREGEGPYIGDGSLDPAVRSPLVRQRRRRDALPASQRRGAAIRLRKATGLR